MSIEATVFYGTEKIVSGKIKTDLVILYLGVYYEKEYNNSEEILENIKKLDNCGKDVVLFCCTCCRRELEKILAEVLSEGGLQKIRGDKGRLLQGFLEGRKQRKKGRIIRLEEEFLE